jgi:hypothetical protein
MIKETGYEKIPHAIFNKIGNQVSRSYPTKADAEIELPAHVNNSIYKPSFFHVDVVKTGD